MSTKGNPGPFDGMERAQPGEPVFTLRAHDPLAPRFVKLWVWQRRKAIRRAHAAGDINDEKRDLELIQCREAENIAFEMDEWQAGEAGQPIEAKADDKAEGKSYLGNTRSDADLEAEQLWQARKEFGRQAQNAIAEITESSERLAKWGFRSTIEIAMAGIEKLREAADRVAPKGGYSPADLDKEWD